MVKENADEKRWQTSIHSFRQGLAHISKTKEFSDVEFKVGTQTFKAHRLFLVVRSKYFADKLMKEGDVIEIHDVSEEAFEILLNFIYTDTIPEMASEELVLSVYRASIRYDQQALKEACEKRMAMWDINCDTVIPILQMSNELFLRNRCFEYLKIHAREVLMSDGFLMALPDTVSLIFDKGYFEGISTMDLLTNLVRWAERQYGKKSEYSRVREHLLIPVGDNFVPLMKRIGLEKLSTAELGKVVRLYPKLLNEQEIATFFVNSCSPVAD